MAISALFAPFEDLAAQFLPFAGETTDRSHDASHLLRVWKNALDIQAVEGGNLRLLAAAILLHDCVSVEKNSPDRSRASTLAADKARKVLRELGWNVADAEIVTGAIRTHSFSAGLVPETTEGRILQDADRLDAIGFTGVARCFYTAGRLGSELYELADPGGELRELDDSRFALDHFPRKLLRLAGQFQTIEGARLAEKRQRELLHFYQGMIEEISGRDADSNAGPQSS